MPAGGLGREADDSAGRPRAPRRLLVRVALTEGLGVIVSGSDAELDRMGTTCMRPTWQMCCWVPEPWFFMTARAERRSALGHGVWFEVRLM